MRFFKDKDADAIIHGIRLKIRSGVEPLPFASTGAFVTAFSIAADPQEAILKAVRAVQAMGHDFEEILPEGLCMPLRDWGSFVSTAWSDYVQEFPSQREIAARLAGNGVVLTPVACFKEPEVDLD